MVSTHLKNISQIGSFPQIGMKLMKLKNNWNHQPVIYWVCTIFMWDRETLVIDNSHRSLHCTFTTWFFEHFWSNCSKISHVECLYTTSLCPVRLGEVIVSEVTKQWGFQWKCCRACHLLESLDPESGLLFQPQNSVRIGQIWNYSIMDAKRNSQIMKTPREMPIPSHSYIKMKTVQCIS